MSKIRLAAFHHKSLNLNGDVLNLLVLAKRLNWSGIACEVIEVNGKFDSQIAQGIDFALLGHGSMAAWASIDKSDPALETAILALADAQVPIMGVATGFERLVQYGLIQGVIERQDRVSAFTEFEWSGIKGIGYLNSDSGLPAFVQQGNTFGTLLHGPVLAKNPEVADAILNLILSEHPDERLRLNSQAKFADSLAEAATEVAKGMLAN